MEIRSLGIEALIEKIKDGNIREKEEAIFALGDHGPRAKTFIPFLLDFVKSKVFQENRNTLGGAVSYAIHEIGSLGSWVSSPEFLELIRHPNCNVRYFPLYVLAFEIDEDYFPYVSSQLIFEVLNFLTDHEAVPGSTPCLVYMLLAKWYPAVLERALRIKENGLNHWEDLAKNGTTTTLKLLGVVALTCFKDQAIPALARLYDSEGADIRKNILWICPWIGEQAEGIMKKGLSDPDPGLREEASVVLKGYNPKARRH